MDHPSETADQLLAQAKTLEENKRFDEILQLLDEKQLEILKDPRLYRLKANELIRFRPRFPRRPDLAIRLITAAIDMDPNDPTAYRDRSVAFRLKRDFNNAHVDIANAIALNPKDPQNYMARAFISSAQRNRKLVEKDFAKASALSPKSPEILYEQGRFWRLRREYPRGIMAYQKGLRIDKNSSSRVAARAAISVGHFYLSTKKNYELAFKYFSRAAAAGIGLGNLQREFFLFVYKSLSMVTVQKRRLIYKKCIPFIDIVESIRVKLTLSYYEDQVVHFTKLSVADILFSSDDNKFRFYHTAHLNDPEEGKTLLQIFNDDRITESFGNAEIVNESNFYVGSFLPQDHADDLVMWRTYGKDENESEAKGCSIVFDSTFFFDDNHTPDPLEREPKLSASSLAVPPVENRERKRNKKPEQRSRYNTTLYRVIYYNRLTKKLVEDPKDKELIPVLRRSINQLRNQLREIIKLKDPSRSKSYNLAIDGIVYFIINELRYYFKSADYSYENEQRVVMPLPPSSPLVKIEEEGKLPKRLYVESRIPMRQYISKIVLGPRVVQPERWVYLKAKMIKAKYDIEMVKSQCKFQ